MKTIFDWFEKWMIESGLIDQLAFIITKTAVLRSAVIWIAGALGANALTKGEYSEVALAAAVTIATGSVTMFIDYVRNKYAKQLQRAVGTEKRDEFIGAVTVSDVKDVVSKAKEADAQPPANE